MHVGNSSKKRSRGSHYHTPGGTSRIPTGGGGGANGCTNKPTYTSSFKFAPSTPRAKPQLGSYGRVNDGYGSWVPEKTPYVDNLRDQEYERGYATPGTVSPPPLANSRYHLTSGYDTPTAAQANAYEDGMFSSNIDTRFKRLADEGAGRHSFTAGLEGELAEAIAGPLARKSNENGGRSRAASSAYSGTLDRPDQRREIQADVPEDNPPWGVGRAIMGAAAGVAGFVFHFCTAGAFRGFHAGGGQGYSFTGGAENQRATPIPLSNSTPSHIPAGTYESSWHDSDFAQDDLPQSPTPRRAAKKMKSSYEDDGGLPGSWIMVERNEDEGGSAARSTTASPAGLRQRAKPGTHKRRFAGSVGSVQMASSATLRSANAKEKMLTTPSRPSSRPSSSMRRMSIDGFAESPLGKEGEKLLRRQRRREREEDREFASMNARLEEMIRQGKEALGTRYEVQELDDEM